MKKLVPLFLLLVMSINHLNIIDAVLHLTSRYGDESSAITKNFPIDEERESEKENKGKEKIEESEKYLGKCNYSNNQYKFSDKDHFIWFTSMLNKHPYQDDDIQPPDA